MHFQVSLIIEWPHTHPSGCMQRILAKDDSLSTIRNLACQKISLDQSISNYTRSLESMDFRYCPEQFTNAFTAHRRAWEALIPITKKYDDMRGEMHFLFKELEAGQDSTLFKQNLKRVWDTWAEVEKESR